jgi:membrane-bound lytic murein transglycosylase F
MLLVMCLLLVPSCRRSGNESADLSLDEERNQVKPVELDLAAIKKRGILRAIVENSSTGFFIYKGRPMGYEHDLLALYAKSIGVELEIKVTSSIEESFSMLTLGKGDIMAYSLTVTKERKKFATFTDSHYTTRQVLVQKKPENWREMTRDAIEASLIRNQTDLMGKQVHVRKNSAYADRLHNLSQEIGADIMIIEEADSLETEKLISKVAKGEIKYTVADETQALVSAAYYPDIDVKTPISFEQKIAWAVRPNAPELLESINEWIDDLKKTPTYNVIYNKYFKNIRTSSYRARSDYSSMGGEKISIYDDLIKKGAARLGWDWRLLASQIYQESKFNPLAVSWAGAIGLMQMVPETGKRFGATNLENPAESLQAGVNYLLYLDDLWKKTVTDDEERKKFVLASYNVGLGHVVDARELTRKYNGNPLIWEDVAKFLLKKSEPEYFRDEVVKSGYCRGQEPVTYVRQILNRYEQYRQSIST